MHVKKSTIEELSRIQSRLAKYVLQLPRSTTSVGAEILAGLTPINDVIEKNKIMFHQHLLTLGSNNWARICYNEVLKMGKKSQYFRDIMAIKSRHCIWNMNREQALSRLKTNSIKEVLKMKARFSKTLGCCPTPQTWFKLPDWVNDSKESEIIARFSTCNVGLGNRAPLDGETIKFCRLCEKVGKIALNNEPHLVMTCPALNKFRIICGIAKYKYQKLAIFPNLDEVALTKLYLGQDDCNKDELHLRAKCLKYMTECWDFSMYNLSKKS